MKDEKFNPSASHGITFWEALAIAFIILKLTNVITWSWILVLLPLIVEVCIIIFVIMIMFMSDRLDKSNERW